MATLRKLSDGERVVLSTRHVIGRNVTDVHLHIGDTDISRHHAYLFWQDQVWHLRDTSANGTWLNNKRVNPTQAVAVRPGDEIRFGTMDRNTWVVMDVASPRSALVSLSDDGSEIPLNIYNAWPVDQPVLEIIQQERGKWVMCRDGNITELLDGQTVRLGGEIWRAHLVTSGINDQCTEKLSLISYDSMQLQFRVSQDQEHVTLKLQLDDGQLVDFGERAHHNLLLLLARQRYLDAKSGLGELDQGWVEMELLCKQLKMEATHVNIQTHRARKQLQDLLPSYAETSDFVERRPGGLRLRSRRLMIYHGSRLEASLPTFS